MLVLAAAPPHYIFLPISLNSLDLAGVRLLSPCDSQITYKTSCRCRWYQCRWRSLAQEGARWNSCLLCCFVSSWSVVEPSRGDRGSSIRGDLLLFWFRSRTLIVFWMIVMLYSCIVWSVDYKPTMYLFLIQYMGCVKIIPLATLPTMWLCL